MLAKLLGSQKFDFISSDGKSVKGTSIFISYPDENVVGLRCERMFINDSIQLPELTPGSEISLTFNRKGKVETVSARTTTTKTDK